MRNQFNSLRRYSRGLALLTFVSCLATAPVLLRAQRPVPVPPDGLKSARRVAPDALKRLGAETFQLTVGLTGAVQISLFDSANAPVGTATFNEEVRGTRFRYSFRHYTGKQASVAVSIQEAKDQTTSTMTSSNGRTLTLIVEQDAAKRAIQGSKIGIKRVRAHDGRAWKTFTPADLKWQPPADDDVAAGALAALEDEVLFTTDELKWLRASLRSVGALQQTAFGQNLARKDEGVGFQRVVNRVVARQACRAFCVRQTTLSPIYVCDDGYWNGCYCPYSQGFWYIGGCGWYLWCNVPCGDFCINQPCGIA